MVIEASQNVNVSTLGQDEGCNVVELLLRHRLKLSQGRQVGRANEMKTVTDISHDRERLVSQEWKPTTANEFGSLPGRHRKQRPQLAQFAVRTNQMNDRHHAAIVCKPLSNRAPLEADDWQRWEGVGERSHKHSRRIQIDTPAESGSRKHLPKMSPNLHRG